MRLLFLMSFFVLLGGCASNIPIEIREDISGNTISINAAASNFEQNKGRAVRWGGTIAKVENHPADTWIEIVGKKLGSYGQPVESDQSQGRFIARINGFLDPAIYKVDREITVYGVIENRLVKKIDNHPYTYPVVKSVSYYLWDDYQSRRRYYYYPYDPFYYPYYYPYYYRFHFGYGRGFYPGYHFGLHHHFWY